MNEKINFFFMNFHVNYSKIKQKRLKTSPKHQFNFTPRTSTYFNIQLIPLKTRVKLQYDWLRQRGAADLVFNE